MLNPKRLALLIRKQAVENYRFYLMAMALFTGLLACLYALTYPALQRPKDFQEVIFIASLVLGGCVFTDVVARDLSGNTKTIWFLMLPASALEKLLNLLFYAVVLFVPVHLLLFYAVDVPAVAIYNARHPESPSARVLDLFDESSGMGSNYLAFLVVQALVLVGSVYFKRYSLVKSVLGVFACYIILFYLNGILAVMLMDAKIADAFPLTGFTVIENEAAGMHTAVTLPETARHSVAFATKYLLTPFLWLVAYFKLKEREV